MEVLAEVERSGFVESRHLGAVAVAGPDGELLAAVGDPDLVVYPRSCSKPFQALAVRGLGVELELGFGQLSLAGACGSHDGEPDHVASVRKVLAAAGLEESDLRCPPILPANREARARVEGPAPVYHNCSGKHAYMLAGSVVRGMPLRGLATAYARLGARAAAGEEGPSALREAVRRHPFMVAGSGQLDTVLLEATGGRVLAKVGAEAAYAAVDLDSGIGLALKVVDGAPRARGAALLAALRGLGWLDEGEWAAVLPAATVEVHGGGRTVGAVRPAQLRLQH